MTESHKRSVLKSISWQVLHMLVVATIAYILTGKIEIAAIISVAELIWESAAFYLHERAWNKFGKKVK